jgi:hypothetical protein
MIINPSVAGDVSARAIIDASSAILLYKADLIDISCQMVQLLMTRSVFEEVTVPRQIGARQLHRLAGRQPGIIVLGDPSNSGCDSHADDIERLGRGERDTLKHYLNAAAPFVIIDDGRAVRICRRYGIPHINALLVPKLLYFSGRLSMDQMDRFFTRLCSIGRYSDFVVDWARGCGAGQLDFFLVKMGTKMERR